MKTKTESSTRTEREKKLNIFRFSIKPTLIKSGILLALLMLFYFLLPRFIIPTFVVYSDQMELVLKLLVFRHVPFLALFILTGIRCLWINAKKVRIRKGTIMYRYGIIFKRTKVYSYAGVSFEVTNKAGLVQKILNLCTVKISGLQLGDKKKRKDLVFKNMKQDGDFMSLLFTAK